MKRSMEAEILAPEEGILYRVRFTSKGERKGESEIIVRKDEGDFTLTGVISVSGVARNFSQVTLNLEGDVFTPLVEPINGSCLLTSVLLSDTVSYASSSSLVTKPSSGTYIPEFYRSNLKQNPFDNFGFLLDLPRLPDESNADYRARLLTVFPFRANSTYAGLLNGIARELGITESPPIYESFLISTSDSYEGSAPSEPRIEIDGFYIRLYPYWRDQSSYTLELEYDLRSSDNLSLTSLAGRINDESSYFTAMAIKDGDLLSSTLIHQDNMPLIIDETIPKATRFKLKKFPIKTGTLSFSDKETFSVEVSSEEDVINFGQYYVDYSSGVVYTYSLPLEDSTVYYKYIQMPFTAIGCNAILNSINSRPFQRHFYEWVTSEKYTDYFSMYKLGKPNAEVISILSEILNVGNILWAP